MPKYVLCLTTVGSRKSAEKIAEHLVSKKCVACVSVVPGITSFYFWKKKLCREGETQLVMKTLSGKLKKLEKELNLVHPYELPEFVVLPILKGSADYLKWLERAVKG